MFEFITSPRVVFGVGVTEQLPEITRQFGSRVFLVTGANQSRTRPIIQSLEQENCAIARLQIAHEPTVRDVQEGVTAVRAFAADVVVAIGGGSALDAGKAIAAVSTNPGELEHYLEVVGQGKPLEISGLPCIAVPTTSGTGAEVTRNAVIDVPSHSVKVSLRGPTVLPRVAMIDPALTLSVPPEITAATGFDALTQVIEPYVSNRANPMTDALARAGIELAARSLRKAFHTPDDINARTDMALVSLWGGICLTNARLGAVHGLAGPIGGMSHASHGAICAALLGPVMRANLVACQRRGGEATVARFRAIARMLTENASACAEDAIDWIEEIRRELGIRGLGALGIERGQFGAIAERAARASSMQGNPVPLTREEITTVLECSL